jgi:Mg2+-importing ATPase
MIRTEKLPFVHSSASLPFLVSTCIVAVVALGIGFTRFSVGFDMQAMPLKFIPWLVLLVAGYLICVQAWKKVYMKRYQEWM